MSELKLTINLHDIRLFDNYELFDMLLKYKIINDDTMINENTVLEYLIIHKRKYSMKLLIEKGFDINKVNKDKSLLYFACSQNNLYAVNLLLKNKADVNYKRTINHSTPLYLSVQNNYYKIIKELIINKADMNCELKDGVTPMLIAIQNNNEKIIELLIKNKSDINKLTKIGVSPLCLATQYDYSNIIELFIKKNIKIDNKEKNVRDILNIGMIEDSYKSINLLINYKIDINIVNDQGKNNLMVGLDNSSTKCCELLIKNKIDLDLADEFKLTALHYSVKYNNDKISKLLIENKVDINVKDINNITPLYIATINNNYEIVNLLIEKKANMEIKITDSKYLITNPILKINNEMKLVYDNKIDYDLMNRNYVGSTPIYMAIVNKNIKIIELLLEKKCNPNNKLYNNQSMLHTALMTNYSKTVSLLLNSKANPDFDFNEFSYKSETKEFLKCIMLIKEAREYKKEDKLNNMEEDNCPICLEAFDLNKKEDILITDCYHYFHKECWKEYGKLECPICRTNLRK